VCDLPVRAAKFVSRKNWVITGSVSIEAGSVLCYILYCALDIILILLIATQSLSLDS